MPLTDAGALAISKLIIGDTQTNWANVNARIGVGDSNAAFVKTQTDLQAATLKFRKIMDGGFPTRSGATLSFRSTFGTSEANFPVNGWQEWGVFNAGTAGDMLNRKVESLGTKTAAQSWQFTVDLAVQA